MACIYLPWLLLECTASAEVSFELMNPMFVMSVIGSRMVTARAGMVKLTPRVRSGMVKLSPSRVCLPPPSPSLYSHTLNGSVHTKILFIHSMTLNIFLSTNLYKYNYKTI